MRIIGDSPIWKRKNAEETTYPKLPSDLKTEVVIVGGGTTGALTAHYLMKQGVDCVLVDKNRIAMNATCASTAILQYEIDRDLTHLSALIGEQQAQQAFLFDYQASQIVKEINSSCDFSFKPCFYYTQDPKKVDYMSDECKKRQAIGIHCELFTAENDKEKFSFNFEAGIFSHYGAAIIDPVRFTRDLIAYHHEKGLKVFEQTNIVNYDLSSREVILTTDQGLTITANKLIVCTGYDAVEWFKSEKPFYTVTRSFTIVSKPVEDFTGWKEACIIRDDQDPYTYVRPTADNCILIGGEDIEIDHLDNEIANMGDRHPLALQQYHQLLKRARQMFPQIENIKTDCWFHGVFIDTEDGLPFIGKHPDYPGAYFNLGYGSNGILYALIGAKLISQDYIGKNPKELELYRFNRY